MVCTLNFKNEENRHYKVNKWCKKGRLGAGCEWFDASVVACIEGIRLQSPVDLWGCYSAILYVRVDKIAMFCVFC